MTFSTPAFLDEIGFTTEHRVHMRVTWNKEVEGLEGTFPKQNIGQRKVPPPTHELLESRALNFDE